MLYRIDREFDEYKGAGEYETKNIISMYAVCVMLARLVLMQKTMIELFTL